MKKKIFQKEIKKEIIKKWEEFVKADLSAAKVLYKNAVKEKRTSWHTWMLIIWHCHQVVEKSLKMVIVSKDKELLRIHDLPALLEHCEIKDFPKKWKEELYRLNNYYFPPRYPDVPLKISYPKSNKDLAKKFLKFSEEIHLWLKNQIIQRK